MLILSGANDTLRLTTSSAAPIDVVASYVDSTGVAGSNTTPDNQLTAIASASTATVIGAPGAGVHRAVKSITIRNKSGSTPNDLTVLLHNGTTGFEIYEATIGPGGHLHYTSDLGWIPQSLVGLAGDPWAGQIIACQRDGNPNYSLSQMQLAGNVAPTPTNISATVARCELFRPAYDITVNRARWYGVGAVTGIYTMAIYRLSDLVRVSEQFTITTAANTWGSVAPASAFTLTAGVPYFLAVGANATGTTAGIGAVGGTIAAATGQINTAPGALPGNLDIDASFISSYRFQFAVTAGAMPATAPALAAQAAWTGGMPMFWLDNNAAA